MKYLFRVEVEVKGSEHSPEEVRQVFEDALIGEEFIALCLGDNLADGQYDKVEIKLLPEER